MKTKTIKNAFIKTIPVMVGYLVLGAGFGILKYLVRDYSVYGDVGLT